MINIYWPCLSSHSKSSGSDANFHGAGNNSYQCVAPLTLQDASENDNLQPHRHRGACRRKWQPTPVVLPGKSHGAWCATVHGVAKSHIWVSDWTAIRQRGGHGSMGHWDNSAESCGVGQWRRIQILCKYPSVFCKLHIKCHPIDILQGAGTRCLKTWHASPRK